MKVNKIGQALTIFWLLSVYSCDSSRVHDAYFSINKGEWESSKSYNFLFEIYDTVQKNNLYINIRNNHNYAYRNLFLITQLKMPNGKKIVDTLEYEMADGKGNFLGNGFTEIKSSKLLYKKAFVFPNSGNYEMNVSQAMRENGKITGIKALKGITEVGFRVEKQ